MVTPATTPSTLRDPAALQERVLRYIALPRYHSAGPFNLSAPKTDIITLTDFQTRIRFREKIKVAQKVKRCGSLTRSRSLLRRVCSATTQELHAQSCCRVLRRRAATAAIHRLSHHTQAGRRPCLSSLVSAVLQSRIALQDDDAAGTPLLVPGRRHTMEAAGRWRSLPLLPQHRVTGHRARACAGKRAARIP